MLALGAGDRRRFPWANPAAVYFLAAAVARAHSPVGVSLCVVFQMTDRISFSRDKQREGDLEADGDADGLTNPSNTSYLRRPISSTSNGDTIIWSVVT